MVAEIRGYRLLDSTLKIFKLSEKHNQTLRKILIIIFIKYATVTQLSRDM